MSRVSGPDGIAIVGMAGRFPGASSVDELWTNLLAGRESITRFTADTLSPLVPHELSGHPRYVPARGIIDGADRFDAAFFGIPPREALMIDPQQRIFLELCWNALEHAGVDPQRFPGSIGVYAGVSNNSYRKLVESRPDLVSAVGEFATMLANEKDYVATRVAHRLDLRGPALSIHTACSTSLVAIAQAWYALMSWQCDLALAGGINIAAPQESGYLPVEGGGMESGDGHCRPFDAQAGGTLFSSGGAVVALKRLADAIEQGDTIWAVIRGVAVNNDGSDKASFTAPSVRGQAAVIRQALAAAGVSAGSIGYVEAHGTGTQLGDPIEIEGLTRAFREDTAATQFCWLGSVKSNFGHLVAASGVTGLIKAALALHYGRIPPTLNYKTPNPGIDFGASPFRVADREVDWPRGIEPRRAGVSSFGVGGTNAHVVLEEAPAARAPAPARPVTLLVLSARDESSLKLRAADLSAALQDRSDTEMADIGYTLAVGRKPMATRCAVAVRNVADARDRLSGLPSRPAGPAPRLIFLFPGQGSQHANMARELVHSEPVFKAAFARCCVLASRHLDRDLLALILPPPGEEQASDTALAETRYTQPALFAVEYALAELWESWGYRPASMIGHSIGEYVAACRAGVFILDDAIALVVARGAAMFAQPQGAMLAVPIGESDLSKRLPEGIEIAALNAPGLTVVAGPVAAIATFAEMLAREDIESTRLRVSHAFHSAMMDGALPLFRRAFEGVKLAPPQREFYSCVTGAPITPCEATSPDYWRQQLRLPVRFADALGHALAQGPALCLEVGPGQALTRLSRGPVEGRGRAIASLGPARRPGDAAEQVARALGESWSLGAEPDWARYYSGQERARLPLPGYPFRGERYWIEPAPANPAPAARPGVTAEDLAVPAGRRELSLPGGTIAGARTPQLLAELRELFEHLSGERMAPEQDNASFLDLGLDSLSLTQASLTIERRYGLKLKFRRLMEDIDTVARLAAWIEATLPAAETGANPAFAELMQNQMALMSRQTKLLEALTNGAGSIASEPAAPREIEGNIEPADLAERPFGASARITTRRQVQFTPEQGAWVDAFTRRYTARTAKSKEFSRRHRQLMADPRVVTGFNPLWKELTYPIVVDRSLGARLWDLDGHEYIDLLNGFGVNFFGYQPDFVVDAIRAQALAGFEIGPQHPLTADVAQLISEMTGMARVAFCNTGSEAVMGAMRIARTVTGRRTIVIFKDSYHGIFDEVIVRGSRQLRSIAAAPGILPGAVENILVLEYGSDEALRIIRERADELAAVMIEPVQGRNPSLQPVAFVRELRKLCDAGGSALIFDEVVTGFRIAPGGAQEFYGVRADLATYGKIIGGGLPFAAIAGGARWMDALDGGDWTFGDDSYPEAGVTYFAGTFVRHPLALAAAKAALTHLKQRGPALQQELNVRTSALVERLNAFFSALQAPIRAVSFSSLWRLRFDIDQPFAGLFYYALRERGLHVYEQFNCFLSEAHGVAEADAIAARIEAAAGEFIDAGMLTLRDAAKAAPAGNNASGGFGPIAVPAAAPLTESQMEKWLICQYGDAANLGLNESLLLTLEGALDRSALERALAFVSLRHEAFTLSFLPDGSGQCVAPAQALPLPFVDLADPVPGVDAETGAEMNVAMNAKRDTYCARAVRRPFDLTRAPLARAELLRLAPERHVLLLVAHHLVFDGWSAAVFLDELGRAYSSFAAGGLPALEPAESYCAYALAERARRAGSDARRQLDYWKGLYATLPDPLALPMDRPPPPVPDFSSGTVRYEFPSELVAACKGEARRCGVTFYSLLLASFGALMARLSGQHDFAVCIPFAGQALAGSSHLIGDGVNTLPLRLAVDMDLSFSALARATHRALLDAAENQDLTLQTLLGEMKLPRASGLRPLSEIIFNLNPRMPPLDFSGLRLGLREGVKPALGWDLFFNLSDTGKGLTLDLHYRTALLEGSTIHRWIAHYETLLSAAAAGNETPVGVMPLLNEAQRREILLDWNANARDYDHDVAVPELIDAQAVRAPDRIAVESNARSLTYRELARRADIVARSLRGRGVERGELVGVCVPRSVEMLIALLGVMKSGAAYVPLDPEFPAERLNFMAGNARIRHVLALTAAGVPASVAEGREVLALAGLDSGTTPAATLPALSGGDLAYVLYTSGSTGEPKGVRILHRNLVNFLISMREQPGIAPDDVLCAVTTLSFDIAGLELYLPLIAGARILIATEEDRRDPEELFRLMRERGATMLQTTPSLLRMLVNAQSAGQDGGQAGAGLRGLKLLVGGEELPRDLAATVLENCLELWNLYGPTETTIWSTISRVRSAGGPAPLGKPIANTRIYVLDALGQPAPPGVTGEIWIGGDGVGDGYLHRPDLTAERFAPDPFVGGQARMYRTGDLGSLRAGELYFHGRADRQIKLRGYRIEPGNIEAAALADPDVREAVVVAREFGPSDVRLVLYVVAPGGDPALPGRLFERLRGELPQYMAPHHIESLAALPRTPNGKIDRNALPMPAGAGRSEIENTGADRFVAPRNELERQLTGILERVLGVEAVGVKDSFFDLGGHSLLAVRVTGEIEKTLGRKLPLTAFFQAPTAEQLARLLTDQVPSTQWSFLTPIQTNGGYPPFFWIHGEASDAFLSRYLAPDQPLYGLMHQGHDGLPARYTSVEDIAAHYLAEIRTVQPRGPYYLGGYCFGGMVGFEMAQQLRRRNEEVALLVLLAPSTRQFGQYVARLSPQASRPSVAPELFRDEVERHRQMMRMLAPRDRVSYLLKRLKHKVMDWFRPVAESAQEFAERIACKLYLRLGRPLPLSLRSPYILDVYRQAVRDYAPKSYEGATVLFQEENHQYDSRLEWSDLSSRELEVFELSGEHTDIVKEPHARIWANQLRGVLDAAHAKHAIESPVVHT